MTRRRSRRDAWQYHFYHQPRNITPIDIVRLRGFSIQSTDSDHWIPAGERVRSTPCSHSQFVENRQAHLWPNFVAPQHRTIPAE